MRKKYITAGSTPLLNPYGQFAARLASAQDPEGLFCRALDTHGKEWRRKLEIWARRLENRNAKGAAITYDLAHGNPIGGTND